MDATFLKGYHALTHLPTITQTTKSGDNTFLFMTNDTTHSPCCCRTPDYSVAGTIDNTEYDKTHADRFTVDASRSPWRRMSSLRTMTPTWLADAARQMV